MRVLQVLPGVVAGGGAEQSLVMLAPRLAERGVSVHLAVLTDRQSLVPELEAAGVVVHDLSHARGAVARALALRSVIASVAPAVVHSTLWEADVPTRLASLGTGVPVLCTWANTTYSAARRRLEPGVDSWKRDVVRVFDGVTSRLARSWYHAVTEGVAGDGIAALHVNPDRVVVVERGRDLARFARRNETSIAAARALIGATNGDRILLMVARQAHQKGHTVLLQAFDPVAESHPAVRLVLVGPPGAASGDIERSISLMHHGDRVIDLGERHDVERLLPGADVYVMSSIVEGAAGAVVEAMAVGLPIVATEVEGLRGILVDRENALLSPAGDAAALAARISEALDSRELAERLGGTAAALATTRFDLTAAADGIVNLYHRVARVR